MNVRINSFVNTLEIAKTNHVDAGNAELKKQAAQAKRIDNGNYRTHPQLNKVKNALQTLEPEQLLKVLENTRQALSGNGTTTKIDVQDTPQLKEPQKSNTQAVTSSEEDQLTSCAMLTELLGKVNALSSDSSITSLITRLKGYTSMMNGAKEAYSSLVDQLEQQGKKWASASDACNQAKKEAGQLSKDVTDNQSKLKEAQQTLDNLKAKAAGKNPVPSDLQNQINKAQAAVVQAQTGLETAKNNSKTFIDKTLNPAIDALNSSKLALDATISESNSLINSLTIQQHNVIETQFKQNNNQASSLEYLMAVMSQLIDKSASEDLKASSALKQELAKSSAKDAEKKAKEFDEKQRKAEEMQKTMGCIGKVAGWVITVVSVAAAVFTGGASLALAAVGLALMAADEIDQAVTGHSFMSDGMQAVMNNVVKPLADKIAGKITAFLEDCHVPKDSAEMIGRVVGTVTAAVAVIAAVVVACLTVRSAASTAIESLASSLSCEAAEEAADVVATEAAENVAQTATENAAKNTMQRIVNSTLVKCLRQGMGRTLDFDETTVEQVANRTETAVTVSQAVNSSLNVGVNIIASQMMVDAAMIKAKLMKDIELQQLINEMMSRSIDMFTHQIQAVNQITKNMSSAAQNQMRTDKYITRKMGHIAM
ncbi:invasin B [Izhakiella capsodis]|uniref:Invasin B n=1 Tax=Izhakiella capsodis TaxID=1367852 RepID=A0A1I5AWH4_9GAMM|nr:type III secretion system translocon subunit SctE [Izhakiella capsodis]SFN66731.1 invasin B [Izhakiella capsodis]